jgi:hypothetical protein
MQDKREEFVEPEIIKHEERLADVTLQIGYTDLRGGDDGTVVTN